MTGLRPVPQPQPRRVDVDYPAPWTNIPFVPSSAPCSTASDCTSSDLAEHHHHDADHHHHPSHSTADSSTTRCCPSHSPSEPTPPPTSYTTATSPPPDQLARVVLSVSGLTCSHCEGQLQSALVAIAGVVPTSIKTSVVLSRAELSIDPSVVAVPDLIATVRRKTGLECTPVSSDSPGIPTPHLDLTVPAAGNAESAVAMVAAGSSEKRPAGIDRIDQLDKTTIRVFYHPHIVGARSLLTVFPFPVQVAPLRKDDSAGAIKRRIRRNWTLTAVSTVLTIPVLVLAWTPDRSESAREKIVKTAVSLVLATAVQTIATIEFFPPAYRTARFGRRIEMDMLIALSTTAAYVFSVSAAGYEFAGTPAPMGDFFETSTLLTTLVLLGRLLTDLSRHKAAGRVSVRTLQPAQAVLAESSSPIDARLLEYGDLVSVSPHARVVTDGTVVSGRSAVDERMVSGESMPVAKSVGSTVVAGSVNGDGALVVRVTKLPAENTVATIAALVEAAALDKPRVQQTADMVAGWLVPVMVVVSLVVFVAQLVVRLGKATAGSAAASAATFAIATLIVSCPCAIGLAVPMVVVVASGVAAKAGVIFKHPHALEQALFAADVVFDKTGTLTSSVLETVFEYIVGPDSVTPATPAETAAVRALTIALVGQDGHPVAKAITTYLRPLVPVSVSLVRSRSEPGRGITGWATDGTVVVAGNPTWLSAHDHPAVIRARQMHLTPLCVRINGFLAAVFALANPVRPNAAKLISNLTKRHIRVHLVSGDDETVVRRVGAAVGIPKENIVGRASPAQKKDYINTLLGRNNTNPPTGLFSRLIHRLGLGSFIKQRPPVVIFCGDGTNDAPALKAATVGIHVPPDSSDDTPSDVASTSADVVLVSADLSRVASVLDISRSASWRIWLNFAWAGVYNVIAILGASGAAEAMGGAHGGWRIPPAFAAVGELVSVLPVIVIAVTLQMCKFR